MKPAARLESLPYSRDSGALASRLADRPWFVFLDSCRQAGTRGRYDILACDPQAVLITRGGHTTIQRGDEVESSRRDPFHLVDEALAELGPAEAGELPFAGGAIGFFAYDLGRRLEQLPALANRDLDTPDMVVGLYAHAVVVDHNTQACWLVSHPSAREEPAFLRRACRVQEPLTPAAFGTRFEVTSQVRPEMDFATYAAAWQRIKRYLSDGDVYQVNLTQRFSAEVRGDAWDAYQRLRHVNPAPFSAYLKLPNGAILSSSPERFVRVQGDEVETRPIKGTRRRSDDPAEDARLAEELAASSKDRAENVMIVDLLRNDLSRVCSPESVRVEALCRLERYRYVQHLVSIVSGRLERGLNALDVLEAAIPGGSISGAPKHRACEIISALEGAARGCYCGSLGYVGLDGTADFNLLIRTLVMSPGTIACAAGGGITAASDPAAEHAESLAKAEGMFRVLDALGIGGGLEQPPA